MKGWAKKEAVLRATKSGAVAGWVSGYNVGIPGAIQTHNGSRFPREGCVLMTFLTPMRAKYTLDIPVEAVTFEHKMFKHTIPYTLLPLVREFESAITEEGRTR